MAKNKFVEKLFKVADKAEEPEPVEPSLVEPVKPIFEPEPVEPTSEPEPAIAVTDAGLTEVDPGLVQEPEKPHEPTAAEYNFSRWPVATELGKKLGMDLYALRRLAVECEWSCGSVPWRERLLAVMRERVNAPKPPAPAARPHISGGASFALRKLENEMETLLGQILPEWKVAILESFVEQLKTRKADPANAGSYRQGFRLW